MQQRIMKFVGGIFLLLAVVGITYVAGFRAKSPLLLNTVRRCLRATRPLALKSSGTPGAYASIVRHVGRVTGQGYETPAQAISTHEGFAIALPYGPNTDWLKNVVAAGSATIVHDGRSHRVDRPEVVRMSDAAGLFSAKDQRTHRLFRVDQCLIVRCVEPEAASSRSPTSA
jgi:deazaflavin-dependent oxidoreductase (nitroreductase family)